jgi:hypothetical protein
MDGEARDFFESEELLRVLHQRRQVLEQKIALRLSTIDEFRAVKRQSVDRLQATMSKQNEAARERNNTLLNEIGYKSATSAGKPGRAGAAAAAGARGLAPPSASAAASTAGSLLEAKKRYVSYAETLLPSWKQSKLDAYEEEMKRIRREKAVAEVRT